MSGRLAAVVAIGACVAACNRGARPADAYRYRRPPAIDDGWQTATLDDVKVDRSGIERMTDAIRREPAWNIHAVLIERDGRLVYEEYFAGEDERRGARLGLVAFDRDTMHDLRSMTKSVVSALVGIAAGAGAIRSLDAPQVDFFPEYSDLQTPERRRITLRHALSMSAGLDWNESVSYRDPQNTETAMDHSEDPLRYVLGRPIVAAPGEQWRYNGGLTQLLAAVVQRTTGTPLQAYAQSALFDRLGISRVEWLGRLAGLPSAASGLRLRPRDAAKFGSLYLHRGQWAGRQIVPADWVEQSTRRQMTTGGPRSDGYSYQWWDMCLPAGWWSAVDAHTAVGNGSQRIFVMPALNAVVTMFAGRYNQFSNDPTRPLLLKYIIPSIEAPHRGRCPEQ